VLEPADVGAQIPPHLASPRPRQPLALGVEHLEQLPAAGEQGLELLGGLIRQRPGGGPDPRREEGEHLGIDAVGLGQPAEGLREGAHLARIDDGDRESRGGERGRHRRLVATRGFEHDEGDGLGLARGNERG
jgi:hypothetical protein